MKASEWAFDRIKEAFDLAAQDEARRALWKKSCSKALTTCGASSHQSEDRVESHCLTCARTATVSLWKTTFWWVSGENIQIGGAQFVEVFKAHAAPQGLSANLINALKLLANQQEDGDGLL